MTSRASYELVSKAAVMGVPILACVSAPTSVAIEEAERAGLVARVIADDALLDETMEAARTIAGFGQNAVLLAREAVDRAFETPLAEGLLFERRAFHSLFATDDQKEGMAAFMEKRSPDFTGK